jgi:AcrR family transcriptional regulator
MEAQRHIQTPAAGGRHSDEAVLDAVRASVLDVGVRRTTLTGVARRAGVSRMTLYRRWGDVDRLVRDLLTREFHGVVGEVGIVGGAAAGGDRAALVGAVVAAVSALRDSPLFARVLHTEPEMLVPYVTERLGSTQHAAVELLAAGIRAGQSTGTVRSGDSDRLAHAVLLLTQSFVLSARTVADRLDGTALDTELAYALDAYLRPVEHP